MAEERVFIPRNSSSISRRRETFAGKPLSFWKDLAASNQPIPKPPLEKYKVVKKIPREKMESIKSNLDNRDFAEAAFKSVSKNLHNLNTEDAFEIVSAAITSKVSAISSQALDLVPQFDEEYRLDLLKAALRSPTTSISRTALKHISALPMEEQLDLLIHAMWSGNNYTASDAADVALRFPAEYTGKLVRAALFPASTISSKFVSLIPTFPEEQQPELIRSALCTKDEQGALEAIGMISTVPEELRPKLIQTALRSPVDQVFSIAVKLISGLPPEKIWKHIQIALLPKSERCGPEANLVTDSASHAAVLGVIEKKLQSNSFPDASLAVEVIFAVPEEYRLDLIKTALSSHPARNVLSGMDFLVAVPRDQRPELIGTVLRTGTTYPLLALKAIPFIPEVSEQNRPQLFQLAFGLMQNVFLNNVRLGEEFVMQTTKQIAVFPPEQQAELLRAAMQSQYTSVILEGIISVFYLPEAVRTEKLVSESVEKFLSTFVSSSAKEHPPLSYTWREPPRHQSIKPGQVKADHIERISKKLLIFPEKERLHVLGTLLYLSPVECSAQLVHNTKDIVPQEYMPDFVRIVLSLGANLQLSKLADYMRSIPRNYNASIIREALDSPSAFVTGRALDMLNIKDVFTDAQRSELITRALGKKDKDLCLKAIDLIPSLPPDHCVIPISAGLTNSNHEISEKAAKMISLLPQEKQADLVNFAIEFGRSESVAYQVAELVSAFPERLLSQQLLENLSSCFQDLYLSPSTSPVKEQHRSALLGNIKNFSPQIQVEILKKLAKRYYGDDYQRAFQLLDTIPEELRPCVAEAASDSEHFFIRWRARKWKSKNRNLVKQFAPTTEKPRQYKRMSERKWEKLIKKLNDPDSAFDTFDEFLAKAEKFTPTMMPYALDSAAAPRAMEVLRSEPWKHGYWTIEKALSSEDTNIVEETISLIPQLSLEAKRNVFKFAFSDGLDKMSEEHVSRIMNLLPTLAPEIQADIVSHTIPARVDQQPEKNAQYETLKIVLNSCENRAKMRVMEYLPVLSDERKAEFVGMALDCRSEEVGLQAVASLDPHKIKDMNEMRALLIKVPNRYIANEKDRRELTKKALKSPHRWVALKATAFIHQYPEEERKEMIEAALDSPSAEAALRAFNLIPLEDKSYDNLIWSAFLGEPVVAKRALGLVPSLSPERQELIIWYGLHSGWNTIRSQAADLVPLLSDEERPEFIKKCLKMQQKSVALKAVQLIGSLPEDKQEELIGDALSSSTEDAAMEAFRMIDPLLKNIKDDTKVQQLEMAKSARPRLSENKVAAQYFISQALHSASEKVCMEALRHLSEFPITLQGKPLRAALQSSNEKVACEAVNLLKAMARPRATHYSLAHDFSDRGYSSVAVDILIRRIEALIKDALNSEHEKVALEAFEISEAYKGYADLPQGMKVGYILSTKTRYNIIQHALNSKFETVAYFAASAIPNLTGDSNDYIKGGPPSQSIFEYEVNAVKFALASQFKEVAWKAAKHIPNCSTQFREELVKIALEKGQPDMDAFWTTRLISTVPETARATMIASLLASTEHAEIFLGAAYAIFSLRGAYQPRLLQIAGESKFKHLLKDFDGR